MPVEIPGRPGKGRPGGDGGLLGLLNVNLFEFLFRLITGDSGWFGANGFIGSAFARIVEAVTLQGMRWNQVDQHEEDLGILQDKTQRLEGVIGYGAWYASTGLSDFTGFSKIGFSSQVGPVVGCSNTGGTVTLGSKGLWKVDAQVMINARVFGASDVDMEIRVYSPSNVLHFKREWAAVTAEKITAMDVAAFVVPTSGYKVEVWVHAGTVRIMPGGIEVNGLTVLKISDETS